MAQKVEIVKTDDLDDSEAAETVDFGLDGVSYEIDLSQRNSARLRDTLKGYIVHARRRTTTTAPRPQTKKRSGGGTQSPEKKAQNKRIREWAELGGLEVPDRGRIPNTVSDAYFDAHQGEARVER